jgi:TonB family protein
VFRCFTISTIFHCALIIGMLVLSFIAPPTPKITQTTIINLNPNTRGTPGLPEGDPNLAPNAGGGMKAQDAPADNEEPAPTPKPASTPRPAATPAPHKTKPTEAKKQIVKPKTTPLPKPQQVAEKKAPTVKKAAPVKKVAAATSKKKIVIPDKNKPIMEKPKPKETPAPEPEAQEVATEVTENAAPTVPDSQEVAEFDSKADVKPDVPAAPDVPEPPDAGPAVPAVGPGGNGTGQKLSPHGALSGGIGTGTGTGMPGGGGGSGGTTGGYGYGSILSSLAQTYFAIVLQKIEENFKLPYSRPGVQCLVQFQIEKTGQITNIQVVKSSGFPNLDNLAVQALQMTRLPALYDGIQAPSLPVSLTFNYEKKN